MYVNHSESGRLDIRNAAIGMFECQNSAGGPLAADDPMSERGEQFSEYANGFAEYLTSQTGIELAPPDAQSQDSLRGSFERLDLALGQIADLASVYGDDSRHDIEPLTLPTAVLAGEYLRVGLDAHWLEPAYKGDAALLLATPDGIALDMDGIARTALMSSQPNLTALVDRLLNRDGDPP